MQAIERLIHLLGEQDQACSEDIERTCHSSNSENPGNFLLLLQQIALYNPILAEHLNIPLSKTATYLSPLSQNKLIEVTGINTIQMN